MQVIGCCSWLATALLISPQPRTPGRVGAPEGEVVQAHARHHEQEAVPQDPLVVFVLLLPGLRPLWPHTVELGPVLSVGGFPGAAGEIKGSGKLGSRNHLR